MQLNKCSRCGCFFMTDSDICPNCQPKDINDINKLKNFLADCDPNCSFEDISNGTGISEKNLHRFFKSDEIANFNFSNLDNNPKISL